MRGWSRLVVFFMVAASLALGQVGNGTITGTVTDPAGGVVPAVAVQAKNADTGVVYTAASSAAGIYTITDLPVGTYTVTATVTGFKTYTHSNLVVAATQVLRQNVPLEVGNTSESVTVTAESSLLQTETGDLASNVTIGQMDQLPLLGIGTINAGTSGYRNPYNTLLTLPGVSSYNPSGLFTINGLGGPAPGGGFGVALGETMRVEGQDATSRIFGTYDYTQMAQPGVDSIQEIAVQTSNYAAEYGQAGTAVINMTMKSGTNQYHGSGYDYFVNEDLNAGDPFSSSATGPGKVRQRNRRNDFGGTLGGPIDIPHVYNGHNKTFFFFSYEEYLEHTGLNFSDTVPVPAYLQGNFSAISPNGTCSLCSALGIQKTPLGVPTTQLDPLGRQMYANEIYDPNTRAVAPNGLGFANPFPNNVIPSSRFNATSLKFQSLFPAAQNSNLFGNYAGIIGSGRYSAIPAVKIDHNISDKDKLSFYYSENNTESQYSTPLGNADGLPPEIGGYRGTFIPTYTERLNYDRTLTPTLLLHLGAGYLHTSFSDRAPFLSFNPSEFGLSNFVTDRQFPSVTGMCAQPAFGAGCAGVLGGMQNIGTSGQGQALNYEEKPSFDASTTWVKGKHTYKLGAEMYLEQIYTGRFSGVTLPTGTNATSEPFTPTSSFAGYSTGFGYGSFLLGDYGSTNPFTGAIASTTQTPQETTREGQAQWGLYIQDSWKVTSKLTVDYGLRWDFATPQQEQYGRLGQLNPTLANPNAGGLPGSIQYASTCGCNFYQSTYPFGIGPRLGVAYQIDPKTVFRAGWGVNYQYIGNAAGSVIGTNGVYPLGGINPYLNIGAPGSIVQPTWPVTNPFLYPVAGSTSQQPFSPDRNQNRPPRINQWSIGIQREITPNFILEAEYVGNRAVWLSGPYGYLSQIGASGYANDGLYPYPGTGPCSTGRGVCSNSSYNNYADYLLLQQPINSPNVINAMKARGVNKLIPYAGFPTSNSLQSTLYPFPQFGGVEPTGSPTGDSRYDSLQMKATKRFSHGLQAGGSFTWAKGFQSPVGPGPFGGGQVQDFFNRSSEADVMQQIPPLDINFNFLYTVPSASYLPKFANLITKDWEVGGFANYQSGIFLTAPVSPTNNFLPSADVRVPGQPLYTPGVNPNNLSTYSPYTTQVLNPNAWAPCPVNSACTAQGTLYPDFRAPRTPTENANIGRNFRLGKEGKYNLYIRAEFINIFNRTLMPAPITNVNPALAPSRNGAGVYNGGFGIINAYSTPGSFYSSPAGFAYLQPRTGTIIARFTF